MRDGLALEGPAIDLNRVFVAPMGKFGGPNLEAIETLRNCQMLHGACPVFVNYSR
jgi:hypothetical protein